MSWSKWDGVEPIDADTYLARVQEEDAYHAGRGKTVGADLTELRAQLLSEAAQASRPGQHARLTRIADDLPRLLAEAWDFGYSCGLGDYGKRDDETQSFNPYRGDGNA